MAIDRGWSCTDWDRLIERANRLVHESNARRLATRSKSKMKIKIRKRIKSRSKIKSRMVVDICLILRE